MIKSIEADFGMPLSEIVAHSAALTKFEVHLLLEALESEDTYCTYCYAGPGERCRVKKDRTVAFEPHLNRQKWLIRIQAQIVAP